MKVSAANTPVDSRGGGSPTHTQAASTPFMDEEKAEELYLENKSEERPTP